MPNNWRDNLPECVRAEFDRMDHEVAVLGPPTRIYVNTGPEHMPLGLADRKAHDARLAERGERDES